MNEFILVDTEHGQEQFNVQKVLNCVEKAYDNSLLLYIAYKRHICKRFSTSNLFVPYGIVNNSGFWYIVGFCYELETYRTLNTVFINNIYITGKNFAKDKDFNLDKYWETQKLK